MNKATLYLDNIALRTSDAAKLRGYIGNLFQEHDLLHNHDASTGKLIYRYPLVQFKVIDGRPYLVAVTDKAVKIFAEIFINLNELKIGDRLIPIHEKNIIVENIKIGITENPVKYKFLTPWLALNQQNHEKYKSLPDSEQDKMLDEIIVGNILSLAKGLGYWIEKDVKISAAARLRETSVRLKGEPMIGFMGTFEANFVIPDLLGLGKSVSRGFGSVKKINDTGARYDNKD